MPEMTVEVNSLGVYVQTPMPVHPARTHVLEDTRGNVYGSGISPS